MDDRYVPIEVKLDRDDDGVGIIGAFGEVALEEGTWRLTVTGRGSIVAQLLEAN